MKETMRKFFDYFLLGTLSVLPILVVVQIVVLIERLLRDVFRGVHGYYENYWITASLFAITISVLGFLGYRIRHGKTYMLTLMEAYLEKLPILSTVYRVSFLITKAHRVSKKLIGIFSGEGQNASREVVYVEYPKDGVWVPAYVTNQKNDLYVLYVPTSPNPTSGFTIMVHRSKVVKSAMTFEEASSFVISVGVDFSKVEDAATKLIAQSPQ